VKLFLAILHIREQKNFLRTFFEESELVEPGTVEAPKIPLSLAKFFNIVSTEIKQVLFFDDIQIEKTQDVKPCSCF
jgi:hypothetical protein